MSAETSPVDVFLYVALSEEFRAMMPLLGPTITSQELLDAALTVFFADIYSPVLGRNMRLAVLPAGKMGNTRSAGTVTLAIEKLSPANVVVLGIAGSLTSELQPGDVFIPDSVNEYLANSAATGARTWSFQTSGNQLQTSARLLNRFQLFEQTQPEHYAKWRVDVVSHRNELLSRRTQQLLRASGLAVSGEGRLYVGDDLKLASGPAVGKSKAFAKWLTDRADRKVAAIEMESAGVYDAAFIRQPAPRVIAIRGISDIADGRKQKIEKVAKNRVRQLAARNALSLLLRSIEAGLFGPDGPSVIDLPLTASSGLNSRLRSAFVIGGETAETTDPDGEAPRLHRACLKLGRLLASTATQLIICSPFPDSADYYVAMGYAEGEGKGVIHLHSPSHPKVAEKTQLFIERYGREGLTFQSWLYPGPDNEDSWTQAWLLAQLQALERADSVIALGGKVSKSANTLLHLAEARGLPIVPFAFLGGAAARAFARLDWKRIDPSLDATVMERDAGIDQTMAIADRLMVARIKNSFEPTRVPETVFVSFAKKDLDSSRAAMDFLKRRGLEVLTGDGETRHDQMVAASIERALLRSEVCIVLWSRNYAVSPWCYDELLIATDRQAHGAMKIWFFNLDDSPVVPTHARKLPTISARTPEALVETLHDLLSGAT